MSLTAYQFFISQDQWYVVTRGATADNYLAYHNTLLGHLVECLIYMILDTSKKKENLRIIANFANSI